MTTPNFSITELAASQAQKYVTVNEALRVVDTALNLTVIRTDNTAPPGSPSEGDKYIPLATATGAWAGQENNIACFINAEWIFFAPAEGWRAYDQNSNTLLLWNGTSWLSLLGSAGDGSAAAPAYSFASDTDTGMYRNAANELGFATGGSERLKITNTQITATIAQFLLTDAGSDANFTVSKQATADDAVLTLQTNFSTRAIIGTQGDDDFLIKVSPDGSAFTDAFKLDKDNGRAEFASSVRIGNGSASVPAFSFTADTDTGMYRNAADELGFSTGGSERFKLTSSQVSSSVGNWLLNNAGSDSGLTVNKNAAGDDATLTFQTAFSHYASMGLMANNDFTIKVGTGFTTAMVIDEATGDVTFPAQTSIREVQPFGGRWRCETDNRWVGPANYMGLESKQVNGGTGATPNVDWDAKGDHFFKSGTVVKGVEIAWNINNAEVTACSYKVYFQYNAWDGNADTTGETTRVEVDGGTFTPAGAATAMNLTDLGFSEYTCPADGFILLYIKPSGTITANWYFQCTGHIFTVSKTE